MILQSDSHGFMYTAVFKEYRAALLLAESRAAL